MKKILKKIAILCTTSIIFGALATPILANDIPKNINYYDVSLKAQYVPLEISKNISQYYLDTFYYDEQSAENEYYSISDKYNFVYNIENQLIGYLFRIINKSTEEIGYIITGNNNEVATVFEASIGNLFAKDIDESEKVYYISPLNIVVGDDFEQLSTKNTRQKSEEYKNVKSNEWENLLNVLNKPSSTTSSQLYLDNSRAKHTIYSVNREPRFVKIKDGSDEFFGGNQSWYKPPYKTNNSCGAVAAANIMAYMAKEYPEFSKLYAYSDLDSRAFKYSNFLRHMETMYDYVKPGLFGVPTVEQFQKGVDSYIRSKLGTSINSKKFVVSTYPTIVNNVIEALKLEAPLALLILNVQNGPPGELDGSGGNNFAMHWITITKYFKDGDTNVERIAFSSWGDRYSVPLYDLWHIYDLDEGIYYY